MAFSNKLFLTIFHLPYGYGIFSKDLKQNILNLSPLYSGSLVFMSFFRVLSWKILNVGDISLCLWSAAAVYFMDIWSGPEPLNLTTSRSHHIARWALFLLITLPQYIRLVTFRGVLWTQMWTTCFVMHFITHELLAYHVEPIKKKVKFETDWPAKPFMRHSTKSTSSTDSDAAPGFRNEKNENTSIRSPPESNACDAVQSFIFPLAEKDADQKRHGLSNTEQAGFWMTLVNPSLVWSCGHVRCLLYKFACIPAYHTPEAWIVFTFLLLIWLLHSDLRFATVSITNQVKLGDKAQQS